MTLDDLKKLELDPKWFDAINSTFERFAINTPSRQANFLGQCMHESGSFKSLSENLNYSAQGLANTWPSRYAVDPKAQVKVPNAKANSIARKPVEIANHCYANRLGNGDEQSGDGHRYRGRGLIQLTGKDNYRSCGNDLGVDLVANPDLVAEPLYACLTAGWFWSKNNLNTLADAKDVTGITKRINGGLGHLEARKELTSRVLGVLNA